MFPKQESGIWLRATSVTSHDLFDAGAPARGGIGSGVSYLYKGTLGTCHRHIELNHLIFTFTRQAFEVCNFRHVTPWNGRTGAAIHDV